jgi:Subtilase family/PEP-CTERM motif
MLISPSFPRTFAWIAVLFLICGAAHGAVIFTDVMTIGAGDPTQLGRISRNGVPSDWSGLKAFPGVINTTTSYHYTVLDLNLAALEFPLAYDAYIQIDVDSSYLTTFMSAYLNSYNPLNLAANYLGDAGSSGNFFGADTLFFQFFVPYGNNLELVLNETTTNGGVGLPAGVTVEAFVDSGYTDADATNASTVPEPGTWVLLALGMAFLGMRGRARLRNAGRHLASGCAALVMASLCGPFLFGQGTIDPNAVNQIGALLQEKENRTSDQQKLDSQLWYALQASRGQMVAGVSDVYATAVDTVQANVSGYARVDISALVSVDLLNQIAALGGTVTYSSAQLQSISATIPLTALEQLAANSTVYHIAPAARSATNRVRSPKLLPAPRRIAKLNSLGLPFFIGALTSQGDISHTTNLVRSKLGKNGTGVKVGVLSDSVDDLAALIASGDLPAGFTVVPGQSGNPGTSEGTAMAEIIYDLAPGVQLFFATAGPNVASFANNIQTLRNVYGCDIIVDDVTYFNEGVFQDGPIAQAVNAVVASGALYFSAAANSGNLTSGTSGTWEGDFNAGPASAAPLPLGYTLHNFGGGQAYDVLTATTTFISTKWSDPLGGSTNDYDMFVLNAAGTSVTCAATTVQSGTQDPYEFCSSNAGFAAGSRIVIAQKAGAAQRALHVDTERGQLSINTSGATFGHNAGLNTVSVAATYWNSAKTGVKAFVGGAANPTETFSSDGPRRIFYNTSGAAITPGNFLFGTNGGTSLQKPDITAADGASSKTPGFLPFFGTSAAAPHAAGVAALIKSVRPDYTNVQILNAMQQTALDIRAPGLDRDSGWGIVMALAAANYALSH